MLVACCLAISTGANNLQRLYLLVPLCHYVCVINNIRPDYLLVCAAEDSAGTVYCVEPHPHPTTSHVWARQMVGPSRRHHTRLTIQATFHMPSRSCAGTRRYGDDADRHWMLPVVAMTCVLLELCTNQSTHKAVEHASYSKSEMPSLVMSCRSLVLCIMCNM